MHVSLSAVSSSELLDNSASHKFIAASQVTKSSISVYKSFFNPDNPMEVHLDDNSLVISHRIVHLLLNFADSALHTVEF